MLGAGADAARQRGPGFPVASSLGHMSDFKRTDDGR